MIKGISYVPVLNGSVLNCALRDDLFLDGLRSTFYTKDGIYKYPIYLINPFHHADIFERIKKKGLLLDDSIILSDSGGLQEVTLNDKRYSPEEVFKWQQKHSHIGFSVDSLPFDTGKKDETSRPGAFGGWRFKAEAFEDHAKLSKENIDVTKKYRDKVKYPNFSFYGIIQGVNYRRYVQWYEILRDEYLDGYCVKAPDVNPITLAETCMFVMTNINKPVHFLGIGNISRSIVLYYASKYIKQPITFDSSSYDIGTQYRSYLLPFLMNKKVRFVSEHNLGEDKTISNEKDIIYFDDASKLCDCIVCRGIGNKLGEMIKTNASILGGLISVHNLILNIKYINYVQGILHSRYKMDEFVRASFAQSLADKIITAFDMIDTTAEKSPEFALHKFRAQIEAKNRDSTTVQKDIFSF